MESLRRVHDHSAEGPLVKFAHKARVLSLSHNAFFFTFSRAEFCPAPQQTEGLEETTKYYSVAILLVYNVNVDFSTPKQ